MKSKNSPKLIVAIAGPSGAGKSTIGNRLKNRFRNIEHVLLDNYLKNPNNFPKKFGFRNWELPQNFRFSTLIRHLGQLKKGKPVRTIKFPDYNRNTESTSITLKPKKIILVEGLLILTNKAARKIFDLAFYLDLPESKMLERRLARYGFISEYDRKVVVPEYKNRGLPQKKYADFILDATLPKKTKENKVYALIKKYLKLSGRELKKIAC